MTAYSRPTPTLFPLRVPRCCNLLFLSLLALSFQTARGGLVRVPNTTLTLPDDLPANVPYTTTDAVGGLTFNSPMCTRFPAGETNRLYVVERGGTIQVVNNLSTTPAAQLFMDVASYLTAHGKQLPLDSDNGLYALAFHPNYNQNGYFYLYYAVMSGGQLYQRLARFQATGTPGNYRAATSANPATETPLLTILDPFGNHNGCNLEFGADGYLYVSLGDGGIGADQFDNARYLDR